MKPPVIKNGAVFVIGVIIYLVVLLITAPATLIDRQLNSFAHGDQLHLTNTQGTLWTGSGQIEISDGSGQSALAEQLTWQWQPEGLLQLHLSYSITLGPGPAQPFLVTFSRSGIEVGSTELSLPARLLGQSSPRLAALGLTGDIHLQVHGLLITDQGIKGSATLLWREAASALTPVSPFGDYELFIEEAGSGVHGTLRTIEGPLLLSGQGIWGNTTKPSSFLATARIHPTFRQELAPFLRLIGVEHSDGSFELTLF